MGREGSRLICVSAAPSDAMLSDRLLCSHHQDDEHTDDHHHADDVDHADEDDDNDAAADDGVGHSADDEDHDDEDGPESEKPCQHVSNADPKAFAGWPAGCV